MNATSPTKRRAALATLDANAMTTSTTPTSSSKHAADADALPLKPLSFKRRSTGLLSSAPVLAPPVSVPASSTGGAPSVGMKRRSGIVLQDPATTNTNQGRQAEEEQQQQVAKKSKLEHHHHQQAEQTPASTQSSRTHSPDASSVFDVEGAEDATWVTTATELDVGVMPVAARPPPRVVLTREQAREKVEILRLRLGLASYKLRTGQVEVSLADLQARPLPAAAATTTAPASTVENTPDNSQGDVQQQQQQQQDDEEEEDVVEATPPPATADDLAR